MIAPIVLLIVTIQGTNPYYSQDHLISKVNYAVETLYPHIVTLLRGSSQPVITT